MPVKEVIIQFILLVYSLVAAGLMEKWVNEEWKNLRPDEKCISIVIIVFFWVLLAIYTGGRFLINKIRGDG
jgi:formate-dependent nitrite reductase membrane component NrfD